MPICDENRQRVMFMGKELHNNNVSHTVISGILLMVFRGSEIVILLMPLVILFCFGLFVFSCALLVVDQSGRRRRRAGGAGLRTATGVHVDEQSRYSRDHQLAAD